MSVFAPASPLARFIYRHIRVIHVFKISLALLIAHLINDLYPVPYFAWTSVTIVIIMLTLPQVGGTLEKSLQRVVGTILGALYGILILSLTANPAVIAGLTLLGIALTAYRASGRMGYSYLVAGFTLMIVIDGGKQGMTEAVWRTGTILLGCFIAVAVSQLVLPLRARNEWRWLLSDSLMRMAKVWQMHLSTNVHRPLRTRSLLSGIDQRVQRQKGLRRSVTLESRRLRRFDGEIGELIQAQARCLLLLELLAQTRWENSASALSIQRHYAISLQAKQMGQQLLALAAFCAGESPFLPPKDDGGLQRLKLQMQEELAGDAAGFNAQGYAWLIYQMGLQISLLTSLIHRMAGENVLRHT
ncbi:FUSC family protein [Pseudaeromonas sp. ZJS20]|uniref:FUSC family protein n=1 Tax=Pseudaeromonas aegiceratis TaxID=3153928 RepID=UPI00390C6919